MDWCAWMAACNGEVSRRFVWGGEAIVDEGARVPEENWGNEQGFYEDTICALASTYAAGPDEYLVSTPRGILATTAWGRANGVPRRPLGE